MTQAENFLETIETWKNALEEFSNFIRELSGIITIEF